MMKNTQTHGGESNKGRLAGNYRWLGGLLTAVLLLGTISSASAYSSTHNIGGAKGQSNGNGAVTAHFTASYFNGFGGYFTATGERIVKTAPKAFTKDSETILISDISSWPAGTYTIADGFFTIPLYPGDLFFWFSDFDGAWAQSGTIVITDNGDGTGTLNATLYY